MDIIFQKEYMNNIEHSKELVLEKIKPELIAIPNKQRIIHADQFLYVSSGYASVYRKRDNILVGNLFSNTYFNVTSLYGVLLPFYIKRNKETVILSGNSKNISHIVKEQSLDEHFMRILISSICELLYHDFILSSKNSYQAIREVLMMINGLPEEIKLQISIASMIVDYTGLSRSQVMSTLTELKKGEYITLENGKLISIKKLPLNY